MLGARIRGWPRGTIPLAITTLAGLALRLLVVHWHSAYPLSGDEIGFFEQARTFVQGGGFHDMPFMRAPLYPLFLAVVFRLFGAEITAARLVQALLSAATIPLLFLWARRRHGVAAGLVAAALGALYFPLALQATTLLTETLFLFLFALGMVVWTASLEDPSWWQALLSGVLFGLATLTRSIGLPLVGLAVLGYLLLADAPRRRLRLLLLVLLGAVLVILPWTVRNALVHQAFILVDTTGTTNLWMDNYPDLGRDAVKAELLRYPEGERQGISVRRGLASIADHPRWFLEKAWREIRLFFSLEYSDDFLRRPAIWYPLAEVWARALLGDGLTLLLLAAGLVGLAALPTRTKALDLLWLLYVPATTTLFHVELRYRLPFLLALVPYAAAALAQPRQVTSRLRRRPWRVAVATLLLLALVGVLLAQANYPRLAVQVVSKRLQVVWGRRDLERGALDEAAAHARAALDAYPESAVARVLLARVLRQQGQLDQAEALLRRAIDYRSGHPQPHLLLGDLLRDQGRLEEAAAEMVYESRSLQDLQAWSWETFASAAPSVLDLGSGLELGYVRGWHLPERTGEGTTFRWSDDRVRFRLVAPSGSGPGRLLLRLSAGRPADLPAPEVELWLEGRSLGRFAVAEGWHTYAVDCGPVETGEILVFELRAETYRPHRYDRRLDDNRALGVMVDWIRLLR